MTSLSDLRLRGQRSKKVKFQIRNQYKDVYQCLLADTSLVSYTSVANGCVLFLLRSSFFLSSSSSSSFCQQSISHEPLNRF